MSDSKLRPLVVGIFAIQGSVEEHASCVKKCGGIVQEIRLPKHFEGLDGIILPGGESTTMAIIGERWGLFPKLKEWVAEEKPIWGTCAGMILLSDHAIKQARGGQSLVGGLDVHVCRNFFGSQTYSCQLDVTLDTTLDGLLGPGYESGGSCPAIFIRAPVILSVGPNVDVLARTVATPHASATEVVLKLLESANGTEGSMASVIDRIADIDLDSSVQPRFKRRRLSKATPNLDTTNISCERSYEVFVAVRQGNILATAFHPELTEDLQWHRYFLGMISKYVQDSQGMDVASQLARNPGLCSRDVT